MATKTFLDIGAHTGETLTVVLDERWGFDRIVCFEPAPSCWPVLEGIGDSRVEVCRFGLLDRDQDLDLNNPGSVGASIAADKDPVATTTSCEFRSASHWFAEHVRLDEEVFARINVEGSEAALVGDLFSSGELSKIDHLLIHLDVRKSPSLSQLAEPLLQQLRDSGVEFRTAESIQFGGVARGTVNWLLWCRANKRLRDLRYVTLARLEHRVRVRLYPIKVWLRRSR